MDHTGHPKPDDCAAAEFYEDPENRVLHGPGRKRKCGVIKPGTYTSGNPIPACELERGHSGMHDSTVEYRSSFGLAGAPLLPPVRTRYQWSAGIEMQNMVA